MPTPELCPLCKSANNCALVDSTSSAHCWCMQIKMPQSALTKIPIDQLNRTCICRACALQLNPHNAAE